MTPEIKRGSCENCPAFFSQHTAGRCQLGRSTRPVLVPTDLNGSGVRPSIAPQGKCKRPKTYPEFMKIFRGEA